MNSKNSKTPDPHRLLLNLTDKIDLRRKDKYLYQILAFTIHGRILYSNNKFRISALSWNEKKLNYLMDHILYQIFKIILNIY